MLSQEGKNDKTVLFVSSAVVLLFVFFGAFLPEQMGKVVNVIFSFLTTDFGWLYLLTVAFFIAFAFGIALSRYGRIKLGKDDDKPEFGNFQWFAMLFGGGIGIGLVFWSIAEPLMHYNSPPFGTGGTPEAMRTAMRIVFFHWGIHAWVVFAIGGLALAYFQFRKDLPFLISSAFYPLIGDRIYGPIGKAIDILAVFATVFGVATSLGLGSSQIATGIQYIWGIPANTMTISVIIAVMTALFTLATMSGLHSAMQAVNNIKVWLSIAFMVFIFLFGGTVYILNTFTHTLGDYIQNFVGQTFWMGNIEWLNGWTIFYWAWWIAWAPFVGQFVARVSKGRTIREFIFAVMLLPAGFSFIWLAIYGGAAFHLDQLSSGAIQAAIQTDYTTALFATLKQMPGYILTAPLAIILIIASFLGAANSAIFVLAMLTSNGNMDPDKKLRSFWGISQGAATIIIMLVGGKAALTILQTVSIASAFPFMIVMLFMCYSIYKALREDVATNHLDMDTEKPSVTNRRRA